MSEQYLVEIQYINNMIYNKQVSKCLGYDVFSKGEESNFGEALIEFALLTGIVIVAYLYLIALN